MKHCENKVYAVNLVEYKSIGLHWIALYPNGNIVAYGDSFGVEHIPKEIKRFVVNTNIIASIFRIQAYDSIMCGYFCVGFIGFMFNDKSLTDFMNLFLPHSFEKNDKVILDYFFK